MIALLLALVILAVLLDYFGPPESMYAPAAVRTILIILIVLLLLRLAAIL